MPVNLLPHILRPARLAAAAVVIVFSPLISLAAHAGLLGIPAICILASWFFKYAYVLFDHTAWGYDEPPALDIQMLNPLNEQRPLAQVVILGLICGAVKFTEANFGPGAAMVLAALAAFAFPASVAVLGLERNILKALYPLALARMIRGLGLAYLLLLAIIAGYVAAIGWLVARTSFMPLGAGLAMFGVLSMFSVLGGALYERREELGLETRRSPERVAEHTRQAELAKNQALITQAYGLARARSHVTAWRLIEEWLASRGHAIADYHWLCEHTGRWPEPRYVKRLTEDYLERLLTLKQPGQALDVLRQRLEQDPSFRPKGASSTLRLAELAAHGGALPRVARALVSDFEVRFPGDPLARSAHSLAEQLGP